MTTLSLIIFAGIAEIFWKKWKWSFHSAYAPGPAARHAVEEIRFRTRKKAATLRSRRAPQHGPPRSARY